MGGFTLLGGTHNVSYYSNDVLNNTEREKRFLVNVGGPRTPPVELMVHYKPIVAAISTIALVVAGAWSSRRPWKNG